MSSSYPQELPSQAFFESLIRRPELEGLGASQARYAPLVIVYFTARWCGGCRHVDLARLVGLRPDAVWYVCDVDDNTYTPGYCGIRTIPAFQAILDGRPVPLLMSSEHATISAWLEAL